MIFTQPSATAQDSPGQTNHPTSRFIVYRRFRERLCSVEYSHENVIETTSILPEGKTVVQQLKSTSKFTQCPSVTRKGPRRPPRPNLKASRRHQRRADVGGLLHQPRPRPVSGGHPDLPSPRRGGPSWRPEQQRDNAGKCPSFPS